MSFPHHDPFWREVADFIESHGHAGDRVLANDIFWWRFDRIFRYANLHLEPTATYDWVVLHKGELTRFPLEFLESLPQRLKPVLANPVFILWSADPAHAALSGHPDLDCFPGLLEQRRLQAFDPQSIDDRVLPEPGRIAKLEMLCKRELAESMDRFFDAGGYEYRTRRDAVFFAEIDRWLKTFWQGLESADVLDVACGNGRVARAIDAFRSMLEIDLSPVAVEQARAAGIGDPRRSACVMDAENLCLANGSFDVVTFIEGAEHVHDLAVVLGQIARVLKPGGVLILNSANADSLHQMLNSKLGYPYFKTNYQHIREFTWAELRQMLEQAGFVIERAEGIFLYPYWGIPGLDQHMREVTDNDAELVEAMRVLGERAGPGLSYCTILRARRA